MPRQGALNELIYDLVCCKGEGARRREQDLNEQFRNVVASTSNEYELEGQMKTNGKTSQQCRTVNQRRPEVDDYPL
jgi:hypothetical protein